MVAASATIAPWESYVCGVVEEKEDLLSSPGKQFVAHLRTLTVIFLQIGSSIAIYGGI